MDTQLSDVSCPLDEVVAQASDDPVSDGDSETDSDERVDGPNEVDSKGVPQMLEKDLTPFEQATGHENINHISAEHEIEEVQANEADQGIGSYPEAPVLEFRNASTQSGIEVVNPWIPFTAVS